MRYLLLALLLVSKVMAGPTDPSKFDGSPLGAQRVVYQFNFETPEDIHQGLGYLTNHLKGLREFGDSKNSHLVIVAFGNELHMLSRLNRAAYPDFYEQLKVLTDQGVEIHVCGNAARFRGYKPDDFYDLVTVVPSAMTDLVKLQAKGYAYISGGVIHRIKRSDFRAKHPEILD